ncbi:MAG: hypothetical protein QM493_00945 [Sulfurovum sp.]
MSELERIEALEKEIRELKGLNGDGIPTYSFSKILEKLGKDKYQYFISSNFDSTKIDDLKDIYKNLIFVKNEIIEMVKEDKNARTPI